MVSHSSERINGGRCVPLVETAINAAYRRLFGVPVPSIARPVDRPDDIEEAARVHKVDFRLLEAALLVADEFAAGKSELAPEQAHLVKRAVDNATRWCGESASWVESHIWRPTR